MSLVLAGTGGLKWDDVAGRTGARLEDPAYRYARAVFCQDNVLMRLLDYLTMSAYRIIKQRGIRQKATAMSSMV